MRFRELRQVLQHIVLVGLPVGGGACSNGEPLVQPDPCYTTVARTFEVTASADDPPLRLRSENCRVDVDACPDLCAMVLDRANVPASPRTCDVQFAGDTAQVSVSYTLPTNSQQCPVLGRRSTGVRPPGQLDAIDRAGSWLAEAAWLEQASVHAFTRLATELRALGAPAPLIDGALAAATDEVRHAALLTALAGAYGARPPAVELSPQVGRTLEQIAHENTVEGCVRETFSAVIALWQAHAATDPRVRVALRTIARDEARHAALSFAVERFLLPQLPAAAVARIVEARGAAICQLADVDNFHPIHAVGLPSKVQARGLVARACEALWTVQQGGIS